MGSSRHFQSLIGRAYTLGRQDGCRGSALGSIPLWSPSARCGHATWGTSGAVLETDRRLVKLNRMEGLNDGVFAIAITLLAFQLTKQELSDAGSEAELASTLYSLWPVFVSYVVSFVGLGIFWVGDHTLSHFLRQVDRRYLWLNVAFLFSISLIPFSADLLAENFELQTATIVYGSNLSVTSTLLLAKWWCALERWNLIDPNIDPAIRRHIYRRYSGMAISYPVAIALGVASPLASIGAYVTIAIVHVWLQLRTKIMERPPADETPKTP